MGVTIVQKIVQGHDVMVEDEVSGKMRRVVLNGKLVGMLIGVNHGDHVKIGWSVCNPKDMKIFNKNKSKEIALARASEVSQTTDAFIFMNSLEDIRFGICEDRAIPFRIEQDIAFFAKRCKRYFKTNNITVHTISTNH